MRRLTQLEMRIILAIEKDLNDRRDYHLNVLDAPLRRQIRETWKSIFRLAPLSIEPLQLMLDARDYVVQRVPASR